MTIVERIDLDVRCLRSYFQRLFEFLHQDEEFSPPVESDEQFVARGYRVFVRPDMASNVYSLVDFWLTSLCKFHATNAQLPFGFRDLRGDDDLDARHKYLTKVARLDLSKVHTSYDHLQVLRKVRNCLQHGGGHADDRLSKRLATVPNVEIFAGLVTIADAFVWDSLQHAATYLTAVAEAEPTH